MDLSSDLISRNQSLANSGIALRIEQRGQRLNLRGPLPPRSGSGRATSQRLSLGLPADQEGMIEAERMIQLVNHQLQVGRFDWAQWLQTPGSENAKQLSGQPAELISAFQAAFFADPQRRRFPAGSRTTWSSAYLPYLRRLEQIAAEQQRGLDAGLLLDTVASYGDGSRSRQQCATALAALAKHLGIELPEDWRAEAAGYGLHQARFRQLPSDSQIMDNLMLITNPGWRLAYGLMATYGLRNHEVFFCDLSALAPGGDRVLRVLPTTKTGEHQVWPFQPDWVEHFGLERLGQTTDYLPQVKTDLGQTTLQQVGRRVSEQFRRYRLPLTPYDLRHAWAVRTIHIGLPDTVAARMMGHSVAIHTRTYHHWITRRDQQQAVDSALARQEISKQEISKQTLSQQPA
ncbi:MAG: site-specific integrase [Prochlorococcus sp.]